MMIIWKLINSILLQAELKNILIGLGTNVTWDVIKQKNKQKKENYTYLLYEFFAEVFKEFYFISELEFDESIVMNAFLEQVKDISLVDTNCVSKSVIERTTGMKITQLTMNNFVDCFITVCTKEKYSPIFKKIMLDQTIDFSSRKKTYDLLYQYMGDNYCRLYFKVYTEVISALKHINTSMDGVKWNDLQMLIWEIAYNSQRHGKAGNCILKVYSDSLSIKDNGIRFNPLGLKDQEIIGGGGMAIHAIYEKYPEMDIKYFYEEDSKENIINIQFDEETFDINEMSEIVLPSLTVDCKLERLYPEGDFKYYFIDINKTIETNGGYKVASYSGIFRFIHRFMNLLDNGFTKKIYIFFSDIKDMEIRNIYDMLKNVINHSADIIKEGVALIPENL